jgi:hypothetical protein
LNDIFISYASADRDRARAVAQALEARGWSVWWDREIPLGRSYDEVIETALAHARCMLVLWSATAVASEWVRSEASEGKRRAMLVPVFLEAVDAPLAFRLLNGARLDDWQPGQPSAEFERLCARVAELLDTPASGRMAAAHERGSISEAPREAPSSVRAKATARVVGAVAALLVIAGGVYQYLAQSPAKPHSVREPTPTAVATAPLARPDAAPPATLPATPPAKLPTTLPVAQATRAIRPPERRLPRASAPAESKPDPEPASSHPVVAPQVAARTETPTPAASAPAAAPRSLLVAVLGMPVNRSFWSGETRASLAPKLDQAIERAAHGVCACRYARWRSGRTRSTRNGTTAARLQPRALRDDAGAQRACLPCGSKRRSPRRRSRAPTGPNSVCACTCARHGARIDSKKSCRR